MIAEFKLDRFEDDFETLPWPRQKDEDFEPLKKAKLQWLWRQRDSGRIVDVRRRPACLQVPAFFDATSTDCSACAFHETCRERYDLAVASLTDERKRILRRDPLKVIEQRDMPKDDVHGVYAIIRRFLMDTYRQSIRHIRDREKRAKRRSRAATKPDAMHAIERGAIQRLSLLRSALGNRRKTRRLEQLVGREIDIVNFWKAMQIVMLRDPKATDRMIAEEFMRVSGRPMTKHQARSQRQMIARLEQSGEIWASLCKVDSSIKMGAGAAAAA